MTPRHEYKHHNRRQINGDAPKATGLSTKKEAVEKRVHVDNFFWAWVRSLIYDPPHLLGIIDQRPDPVDYLPALPAFKLLTQNALQNFTRGIARDIVNEDDLSR